MFIDAIGAGQNADSAQSYDAVKAACMEYLKKQTGDEFDAPVDCEEKHDLFGIHPFYIEKGQCCSLVFFSSRQAAFNTIILST